MSSGDEFPVHDIEMGIDEIINKWDEIFRHIQIEENATLVCIVVAKLKLGTVDELSVSHFRLLLIKCQWKAVKSDLISGFPSEISMKWVVDAKMLWILKVA